MKKSIKIPIAIAATASILHKINHRFYNKSKLYFSNKKNETESYESSYGTMEYMTFGTGTPLILLHDLDTGHSMEEMKSLAKFLSKKYTVYIIDMLGFGFSERPNLTYTPYLFSTVLNEFIDEIIDPISTPISIITSGNSMNIAIIASSFVHNIGQIIAINPLEAGENKDFDKELHNMSPKIYSLPIIGKFIYNVHTALYVWKNTHGKNVNQEYKNYLSYRYYMTHYTKKFYTQDSFVMEYKDIPIDYMLKNTEIPIYMISSKHKFYRKYRNLSKKITVLSFHSTCQMPHIENTYTLVKQIENLL